MRKWEMIGIGQRAERIGKERGTRRRMQANLWGFSDFAPPELAEGRIPTLPRLSLSKANFNYLSSVI